VLYDFAYLRVEAVRGRDDHCGWLELEKKAQLQRRLGSSEANNCRLGYPAGASEDIFTMGEDGREVVALQGDGEVH
jgi:hypothetical protein